MAQVIGLQLPVWEIWVRFLAPSFGPALPLLPAGLGGRNQWMGTLSLSL